MTLHDTEVLLELRGEPELLAIADALGDVLEAPAAATASRPRRWVPFSLAACLAAGAVVLALLLVGGNVKHGIGDKALAAVGDGPVLHAVLRETYPPQYSLVAVSTGQVVRRPVTRTTEVWFDEERGLKHTITHADGRLEDDELATPKGITDSSGPVWTCARIAQHPVEATKAGVSCNLSGDNGTTPRDVPEQRPTGDPGLTGFVDGYRAALASGEARRIGEGTVDSTDVYWLEFKLPDISDSDGSNAEHLSEHVAVAKDTYRPVLVQTFMNGEAGNKLTVVSIETVSREDANFEQPQPLPPDQRPGRGWNMVGREPIAVAAASSVLGQAALWAGPDAGGQQLTLAKRLDLDAFDGSGRHSRVSAVAFLYGTTSENGGPRGSIAIVESTQPIDGLTTFLGLAPPAPSGFIAIGAFDAGYLRIDGLYVRISPALPASETSDAVLAVARQVRPVPAPR
jgi:hypothetical protein